MHFSFPVGKERCESALLLPERTTGSSMETISSVSQTCHALGLPLQAGNVTGREQEMAVSICWETSNNTDLYLENTHIYFSLLGPKLFSNLKSCILTGTQLCLILIHDSVWAHGRTSYGTVSLWLHFSNLDALL